MILRRLTQSLKTQDWTAIVIEFVLLMCGVFLGIQASNWNTDRIDRESEALHLAEIARINGVMGGW